MSVRAVGDAAVIAYFGRVPARADAEIGTTVNRLVLKLQNKVKKDKLSGQVLKVRSDGLRGGIDQVFLRTPGAARGIVGTNLSYAAKHEYGFNGTESVKQHLRTIKKAWGREISPRDVVVRQHSRSVNMPERSFLRSSLRDMTPEIMADLEAAAGRIAK
jgi:phage gpG-like protein